MRRDDRRTLLKIQRILAGTSEAGCCGTCGSPWRREVEGERLRAAAPSGMREIGRWSDRQESDLGGRRVVCTLGWSQSCACPPAPPVTCVVADIFCGSGTVGLVAARLGRRSIGIDLSAAYLEIAARRIPDGLRPVSKLDPAKAAKPLAGQMSFLD